VDLAGDDLRSRVRSHARRSLRAAAVLGLGLVCFLMGFQTGPTFLDSPVWWSVTGAFLLVGGVLALRLLGPGRAIRYEVSSRGMSLRQLQRRASPARAGVAVWTLLLIGWIAALYIVGRPALAAAQLGGSTGRATALSARSWTPCARCSQHAEATIDVDGRQTDVQLRGVSQDPNFYVAGIRVIYKADNVGVAMAERDYDDGTGPIPPIVAATSTLVFCLGTWGLTHVKR
jgi:hypothetical protein